MQRKPFKHESHSITCNNIKNGTNLYLCGGVKIYLENNTLKVNLICSKNDRTEFKLNSYSVLFNISTDNFNR